MEKTPRYFVVRRAPKRIEMMDEERTKDCTQDERDDQTNFQCRKIKVSLEEKPKIFGKSYDTPFNHHEPVEHDQVMALGLIILL